MKHVQTGFLIPVLIFVLICISVIGVFIYNWVFVLSEHTRINGELIMESNETRVGEKFSLEVQFPEQYRRVYRLKWYARPEEHAVVRYRQVEFSDREFDAEGRIVYPVYDRKAEFTAKRPGTYRIYVEGFYKQNSPQLISRVKIHVRE